MRMIRLAFALGASLASFVFFFSLAYGAKLLSPKMQSPSSWRILDFFIALIMFTIAIKLADCRKLALNNKPLLKLNYE